MHRNTPPQTHQNKKQGNAVKEFLVGQVGENDNAGQIALLMTMLAGYPRIRNGQRHALRNCKANTAGQGHALSGC